MTRQCWRACMVAAGLLLITVSATARADENCTDKTEFEKSGWRLEEVQQAMDDYLRDHRMRANWLKEPRPPSAVGRDYYEWLWTSEFGAGMRSELVERYCGD